MKLPAFCRSEVPASSLVFFKQSSRLSSAKGLQVFDSLGISQFSTLRWSFFQDVVRSAAQGYNSLGIWRSKIDELGLDEACDLLHEMKMSVSSLSWCGGFTGSEGGSFRLQIDDALEAIAQAGTLRASCLIVHPGARNGHIRSHAWRLLEDAFRILLPVAEDYGVRLALEPMPVSSWTMLEGLDETLAFCSRFPEEQVGLIWDLGHLGTVRSAWDRLPLLVNRIALVQLADRASNSPKAGRCMLGQGLVPFRAWLHQFAKCGYRGPWEIETPWKCETTSVPESPLAAAWEFLEAHQPNRPFAWPSQL